MALIATAGKPPHLSRYERDLYEDQIVPALRKSAIVRLSLLTQKCLRNDYCRA